MKKYKYDAEIHVTKQELANKVEQSIWFSEFSRDIFNQTIKVAILKLFVRLMFWQEL